MTGSSYHFFPLTSPFLLAGVLLVVFLFYLAEVRVLGYAYAKIGIGRRYAFSLLLLTIAGSYVNVPIAEFPPELVVSDRVVRFFGVWYVVPLVREWPGTVLAVNLGGAVIPALVSAYLVVKNRMYAKGAVAVFVVAAVVHALARPVRGVGIAVPIFIPPLVTAGVAVVLTRTCAACLAYVAGSLGTLIGADLLNLGSVQGLGAPIAAIGGAGTFDGIFLTAVLAVLLARDRRPRAAEADRGAAQMGPAGP